MARSDFNWVPINHDFDSQNDSVEVTFPIEGSQAPIDDGYLLLMARGVSNDNHRIFINGTSLPGIDLPAHGGWQTAMDRIPPHVLVAGTNRLRIERAGGDAFHVFAAVVNWREP